MLRNILLSVNVGCTFKLLMLLLDINLAAKMYENKSILGC